MKKLFFVIAVVILGAGFIACEQEEVQPVEELELYETTDPGEVGGGDEDGGQKGGS